MSKIIFSPSVDGHFLEYISHIYRVCRAHFDTEYFFVLPPKFEELKENMTWVSPASNIKFDILAQDEYDGLNNSKLILKSYYASKILRNRVKKYKADSIFTTLLIGLLPFSPLFISNRIKVSGIVYMIYLYRYKDASFLFKAQNVFKYILLSKCKVFDKVFILNDKESANRLNVIYKTNKFIELPDPYIPLVPDTDISIRTMLNIDSSEKMFIHIGAMNRNKGTLELLHSLLNAKKNELINTAFVFAGKVEKDIKDEFYNIVNIIKDNVKIIVKDEFCTYTFFASLCSECDAIVIPYHRTSQSSGIIGYASQFNKPVIAPQSGLLGQLVKTYHLGLLIPDTSPESLKDAYMLIVNGEYESPQNLYCRDHTIEMFCKTIDNVL